MSVMSLHLGQRLVEPRTADRAAGAPDEAGTRTSPGIDSPPTLADLPRGTRASIVGLCEEADAATTRRLFDLGFAPGVEVEMLRRAPLADPVVFRVAGYDIALRRAQARCIQVATLP